MNINDFLPLLMKNSGSANPQMGTLLSALSGGGGDSSKMMEALLSQSMGKDGKNAEMMTLLKLMQEGQKKASKAVGFKPIFNFVPKDILGIMVKHFNK